MAELAADLRMSTKTLYRHFPTKADLVEALMRRWAADLEAEQQDRRARSVDAVADIQAAARSGLALRDRFCPTFWVDLARDYPDQYGHYHRAVRLAFERAASWIGPLLRDDVGIELAGTLLMTVIERAADPAVCDRAGLTRDEAVDRAIDLWAKGALAPAGEIRALRSPSGERPTPKRPRQAQSTNRSS
jgi:AcrR family transcriptional regulator